MKIIEWLKLSEVKNISDLNAPSTILLHAEIIKRKPFLKKLYVDFYNQFRKAIPNNRGSKVLVELGSGGGFIRDIIPEVITSDIIDFSGIEKHFSVLNMPFGDNSVDAFFMINVLHHINDARLFFKELNRCLKVGGRTVIIDQANTLWSRFIYQNFHHEAFNPEGGWSFEKDGPLSSANGAMAWIIFCRDRQKLKKEFPSFKILKLKIHTPFRYIASGGLSMRQLLPSFTYHIVRAVEILLSPLNKYLGMYITIEIEKISQF